MRCSTCLFIFATSFSATAIQPRAAACSGNTATTRSQWCGLSVDTNYYDQAPDTGVTREYSFTLQEMTAAPDGFSRPVYAINNMIPGPTIEANWGDTVVVHVSNNLTTVNNGTSVHFHGIRQNYTNEMDGVTAVTQCPIAVGGSMTYRWRATQYGTSWYHSHIGLQAWDGVAGAIVINGPATANYDVDVGSILLSDWSHQTADELYSSALTTGPPTLTNGIINGTNTWNNSGTIVGTRFTAPFTAGKQHRLRLINGAIDTHFKFSIDNHTLTVIAADFVPVVPFQTTVLNIGMGKSTSYYACHRPHLPLLLSFAILRVTILQNTSIGQRYDVVVNADQQSVAENFWMRAIPQAACSNNDNAGDIRGIVHYGSQSATPTTTGYSYTDACIDEPTASLVPHLQLDAGAQHWTDLEQVNIQLLSSNIILWALNGTSFYTYWNNPTLLQIYDSSSNSNSSSSSNVEFAAKSHVVQLNEADNWAYIIVEAQNNVPHPIHLHGHDFFLLAQGSGTYDSSTQLNLVNPPRRDVALLAGSGYLVLAFKTDNPGAWLMHCHIGWHTDMGLALQFVERLTEARKLIDYNLLNKTCSAWDAYVNKDGVEQGTYDDGI